MSNRKGLNNLNPHIRNSGVRQPDIFDEMDAKPKVVSREADSFKVINGKKVSLSPVGKTSSYWDDEDRWGSSSSTWKGGSSSYKSSNAPVVKCLHSHPALKIPGTDFVIYGGSCSAPAVSDADVYIGFDSYSMRFTERNWPWKKGQEVLFAVQDMDAPQKPDEFKKLIAWTIKQLQDGKKVHAGCIGGHGRTGTFLAALVKEMTGEVDAIAYVRKNYCDKAVESAKQIDFLAKEFGVTKVKASKSYSSGSSKKDHYPAKAMSSPTKGGSIEYLSPMAGKGSIWEHPAK